MGTIARSFTGSTVASRKLAGRCCAGAFLPSLPCFLAYSKLNDAHQRLIASRLAAASGPSPPSFFSAGFGLNDGHQRLIAFRLAAASGPSPPSFFSAGFGLNDGHQRLIAFRLAAASGPSPPSFFSAEFGVEAESPEIQAQSSSETAMVRVIFQLQKECIFGQHFFVVGDDPILGSWDPGQAVPLVWSDGHLWSAEMDLPVGKYILFKFILKGSTGEVTWQPGPDRILETRETKNCIVVSEDWDNVELQKITEENILEETTVPLVITDIEEVVTQGEEVITLEEDEEPITINEDQQVLVTGLISAASSITEEAAEGETQGEEVITLEEDEEPITINEDQQVLVPGLISATSSITEKAEDVEIIEFVPPATDVEEPITINEDQQVLVPGLISATSSITEEAAEDVEIIELVPPATDVEATEGTTLKKKEELMNESEKSNDPLQISKPDDTNEDFGVSMANQSPDQGDQASEEVPYISDVLKNNVQWVLKFLLRFMLKLLSGIMNLVEPAK